MLDHLFYHLVERIGDESVENKKHVQPGGYEYDDDDGQKLVDVRFQSHTECLCLCWSVFYVTVSKAWKLHGWCVSPPVPFQIGTSIFYVDCDEESTESGRENGWRASSTKSLISFSDPRFVIYLARLLESCCMKGSYCELLVFRL
jgi:hypothetical protein